MQFIWWQFICDNINKCNKYNTIDPVITNTPNTEVIVLDTTVSDHYGYQ